ncbi:MAG: type II toxin-antitoxin system YafQ family toxin [Firmicutes bacterium]|nr:type II toxin-antitoxin system YafQ family toxin [[Eubacterium] siraeum]MCM1487300.1 type II toxin-antitoxin system YafQ family toxin [Bacillota bacterium]
MLTLETTSNFRKDYKRIKKRGYDLSLLQNVIDTLLSEKTLDPGFKDHSLIGEYVGFRECHIQPDWLFIYKIDNKRLILVASRTGSHSDLF